VPGPQQAHLAGSQREGPALDSREISQLPTILVNGRVVAGSRASRAGE